MSNIEPNIEQNNTTHHEETNDAGKITETQPVADNNDNSQPNETSSNENKKEPSSEEAIMKLSKDVDTLISKKASISSIDLRKQITELLEKIVTFNQNDVQIKVMLQKLKELHPKVREFNAELKELKKQEKINRIKRKDFITIEFLGDKPYAHFLAEVIEKCLKEDCKRYGDNIVQTSFNKDKGFYEFRILWETDIVAIVNSRAVILKVRNGDLVQSEFRKSDAETLLHMKSQLSDLLEEIEIYTDIYCVDREFNSLPSGWDGKQRTFLNFETIEPKKNEALFLQFVSMFQFEDEDSRIRFITYIYLVVLRECIDGPIPVLMLIGPSQSGKSTMQEAFNQLFCRTGGLFFHIQDNQEFTKILGAGLIEGVQLFMLDNYRSTSKSFTAFESVVTAPNINVRRLGNNALIKRPKNDLVWIISSNGGSLSPDMENRILFVSLNYGFTNNEADQKTRSKAVVHFAEKHQTALLGHVLYEIQNTLAKDVDFVDSLRSNWKNVAWFITQKLYQTSIDIRQGIFRTYLISPLLSVLPRNASLPLTALQLAQNLTPKQIGMLDERNGGFSGTQEKIAARIEGLLLSDVHLQHKIDGDYYTIKSQKIEDKLVFAMLKDDGFSQNYTLPTEHPLYAFLLGYRKDGDKGIDYSNLRTDLQEWLKTNINSDIGLSILRDTIRMYQLGNKAKHLDEVSITILADRLLQTLQNCDIVDSSGKAWSITVNHMANPSQQSNGESELNTLYITPSDIGGIPF